MSRPLRIGFSWVGLGWVNSLLLFTLSRPLQIGLGWVGFGWVWLIHCFYLLALMCYPLVYVFFLFDSHPGKLMIVHIVCRRDSRRVP